MEKEGSFVPCLPQSILQVILGLLDEARHRNAASLVCKSWCYAERQTRVSFVVRGHVTDLLEVPRCFNYVTNLDLSRIGPWGSSLLKAGPRIQELLGEAFPLCVKLRVYVRDHMDVEMVGRIWPHLEEVQLVRWHEKDITDETATVQTELSHLMNSCTRLRALDLSHFFCWAEDIPPSLSASAVANNLRVLDLPKLSPDGLTNSRLIDIAACCPNLEEFRAICKFDPQYEDCVRDTGLQAVGSSCPRLRSLDLMDLMEQNRPRLRGTTGITRESLITPISLHSLFSSLPMLLELSLLLGHHVQGSAPALADLPEACPNLARLELGCFKEVTRHLGSGSWLLRCRSLTSLSLRKCHDLVLEDLMDGGGDLPPLQSFTLESCRCLSSSAVSSMITRLGSSLSSISISDTPQLSCWDVLVAVAPLRKTLRKLRLDVALSDMEGRRRRGLEVRAADSRSPPRPSPPLMGSFELPQASEPNMERGWIGEQLLTSTVADSAGGHSGGHTGGSGGSLIRGEKQGGEWAGRETETKFVAYDWPALEELALWTELGVQLDEVMPVGFKRCPRLSHMIIEVEGDSSTCQGPSSGSTFGLRCLRAFPSLCHLTFNVSSIFGFGRTVPMPNRASLGVWERYLLLGIEELGLTVLEYWPATDRTTRQCTLFMAGSGLLSMCRHLRKLTVHGSVTQHVLNYLRRAMNLRDVRFQPDSNLATSEDQSSDGLRSLQVALDSREITDWRQLGSPTASTT